MFFIFCAFLLISGLLPTGAETAQKQSIHSWTSLNLEMLKILPVLEEKIGDKNLLEKIKREEPSMDIVNCAGSGPLREISEEKQTVSSDIAFLLVTALIVLS